MFSYISIPKRLIANPFIVWSSKYSALKMYISYAGMIGHKYIVPPSFNVCGIGTTKRRMTITIQTIKIIFAFFITLSPFIIFVCYRASCNNPQRIARPRFSGNFWEKTACIATELILLDSMVINLAFSFSFRVVNTWYRKGAEMQEKFLKIICWGYYNTFFKKCKVSFVGTGVLDCPW